jgi:signal transduction histidine kinase
MQTAGMSEAATTVTTGAVHGLSPRVQVAVDVVLAVGLGGFAALAGLTSDEYPNPGPVTAVLMGGAGLVLVVRRSRPLVSFVGSMGMMSAVCLLFGTYQAGTSLLIGLVACYSALAYGVSLGVFLPVVLFFAVANSPGPMPGRLGGTLFVIVSMGLAGAGGLLARRLRELTAANIALRELVELQSQATTRAAVEDERARVARELHDILSHSLGVVVLQTSAAEYAWDAHPERARESLQAARETAVEAVGQLRSLLGVVRDGPSGERAPVPRLDDLAALVTRSRTAGFDVELEMLGDPRPVRPEVQASVYRVAQEGITNALKHSGARACRIKVQYQPDCVVVQVEDDGKHSHGPGTGAQLGLVGVRERAAVFGGRVDAGPRPSGAGWLLEVAFPT